MIDRVTVTYNSDEWLRSIGRSASDEGSVKTVVVDNNSVCSPAEHLVGSGATVVELDENRGFGAACNVGVRRGSSEWIALVNPDCEVASAKLHDLVEFCEERDWDFGAPILRDDHGREEQNLGRPPSAGILLLIVFRLVFGRRIAELGIRLRGRSLAQRTVRELGHGEYLSAACFVVRRSAFDRVSGFDERIFMYGEDARLCERLLDAGYRGGRSPIEAGYHQRGGSGGARIYETSLILPHLSWAASLDRPWSERLLIVAVNVSGCLLSPLLVLRTRSLRLGARLLRHSLLGVAAAFGVSPAIGSS